MFGANERAAARRSVPAVMADVAPTLRVCAGRVWVSEPRARKEARRSFRKRAFWNEWYVVPVGMAFQWLLFLDITRYRCVAATSAASGSRRGDAVDRSRAAPRNPLSRVARRVLTRAFVTRVFPFTREETETRDAAFPSGSVPTPREAPNRVQTTSQNRANSSAAGCSVPGKVPFAGLKNWNTAPCVCPAVPVSRVCVPAGKNRSYAR